MQLSSSSSSISGTQVQLQQFELHISTFPSFTLLSFCMNSTGRQELLHHGFSIGGRLRISTFPSFTLLSFCMNSILLHQGVFHRGRLRVSTLSNCLPAASSKNSTANVVWQISIRCIFLSVYLMKRETIELKNSFVTPADQTFLGNFWEIFASTLKRLSPRHLPLNHEKSESIPWKI